VLRDSPQVVQRPLPRRSTAKQLVRRLVEVLRSKAAMFCAMDCARAACSCPGWSKALGESCETRSERTQTHRGDAIPPECFVLEGSDSYIIAAGRHHNVGAAQHGLAVAKVWPFAALARARRVHHRNVYSPLYSGRGDSD